MTGTTTIRSAAILFTALFLYTGEACAHVEKGHMPDSVAEVEYKILLEFKPRDFDTRTKLALVLIRQSKLDEAEQELQRATAIAPGDSRILEGFTLLKLKQQKVSEALEYAQKAVAAAPDRGILFLHYGKALLADGRPEEALAMYRTGLKKVGGNADDHDRQQLDEAIKSIEAGQDMPAANQ
ncbi:MAG: tetratricopeptide repeat protein [Proteobacteria bacterium]|nr:tetratricopeptide repeat protein [Pseudomonadota bacterium]MBU1738424.1 tetratricopeptide repeat protein [Pseudomonadota bacterium]